MHLIFIHILPLESRGTTPSICYYVVSETGLDDGTAKDHA